MTVTGMFPTASAAITYSVSIQGVTNPYPALLTDAFSIRLLDGTTVVDFSQPINQHVTLTPGNFEACSARFVPTTVKTRGQLVLSLNPTN